MRRERDVKSNEAAISDAVGDALARTRGVAELLEAAQAAATHGVQLGADAIGVLLEAQEGAISGLAELEDALGGEA